MKVRLIPSLWLSKGFFNEGLTLSSLEASSVPRAVFHRQKDQPNEISKQMKVDAFSFIRCNMDGT